MDIHSPYKRRKKMCGDFGRGYLLLASGSRKLAIYQCTIRVSLLCFLDSSSLPIPRRRILKGLDMHAQIILQ